MVPHQNCRPHLCLRKAAICDLLLHAFEFSRLTKSRDLRVGVLPHRLLRAYLLAWLRHVLPLSLDFLIFLGQVLLFLKHALHLGRNVRSSWVVVSRRVFGLLPARVRCLEQLLVVGDDKTVAGLEVARGLVSEDRLLPSHDRVTRVRVHGRVVPRTLVC